MQGYEWQGDALESYQALFEDALKACPETAVAIELSGAGVACYWQERGGDAAVDQIKSALDKLRIELKEKMAL